MAEISAKDVMALRNRTGLAMMECKKALVEAGGDVEKAEDLLRKKLKGKMEKRAGPRRRRGPDRDRHRGDGSAGDRRAPRRDGLHREERELHRVCAEARATRRSRPAATAVRRRRHRRWTAIDNIKITTGENISLGRAEKRAGSGGTFGSTSTTTARPACCSSRG
jgi:elongation factor Ts